MVKPSLDKFFREEESSAESAGAELMPSSKTAKDNEKMLPIKPEAPDEIEEVYLLSATYDGEKGKVALKLYDPNSERVYLWHDNTGHKPYCFSNLSKEEIESIKPVASHSGLVGLETVSKFHPLFDRVQNITKVVASDPLAIGGKPTSIRELLPEARQAGRDVKVWEADIKYYENYIYDLGLEVGMPYCIRGGRLFSLSTDVSSKIWMDVEAIFADEPKEFIALIKRWIRLLEVPAPHIKYAALDIEVAAPSYEKVPDPKEASLPIISVAVVDSKGFKRVLLLARENKNEPTASLPEGVKVDFYGSEREMLEEVLRILSSYPIIVTFNGDEFDLRYIWHRAQNLGINKEAISIELGREYALLSSGIHIDLYRFFFNRAVQIYAFDQKYRETTLQEISTAILGQGKLELEGSIVDVSYSKLASYCLRDAELTYGLTSFDDHLVIKLAVALARVANMPLEDVTRQGVSNWIRSMLYAEHRRRGWLIPTREEIEANKSAKTSEAVIKGKKYRGGIVIEPKPGVKFNVAVLDFSSLYPSIIKTCNLSYETILCPHEDCKGNTIAETGYWICKRRQGLTSLLIGALRDLRVKWYKQKAKDKSLPEGLRSWYGVVQRTLKVILNAAYGVFGAEHFALYCLPLADATAAVGRHAIMATIKKAQELEISVIYGDTDSVFLHDPSEEQIRALIDWSKSALGMDLDVDKIYRYTVFSTRKKNYVGVYPDGSVDIKGLTGKKRNTPEFLKSAFGEVIKALSEVKSEKDFLEAKDRIKAIVQECYVKLKKREYTVDDLAFTVVLGKSLEEYEKTTPQHVKALLSLSPAERERVEAGSVIRFVKIRKEPGVKLCSAAKIDEVDVEKYVEHVQTTFEPILEALDISFNEIGGVSRLESFMD